MEIEPDLWLKAGGILLLLGLSALFSSVESAYFSLSKSALEKMRESGDPRAKLVSILLENARLLLSIILVGNTIVVTAAAGFAALLAIDIAAVLNINHNFAVAAEVVIMSFVILFFSELIPKFLALRKPESWAVKTANAMRLIKIILIPIGYPLASFTVFFSRLLGVDRHSVSAISESEIRALVEIGQEHGALELDEQKMINSIFEFSDTTAREVMIPRIDIIAIEENSSLEELMNTVIKKGHSRIPVYEDTIDNIIGIIYAKDLLAVTYGSSKYNVHSMLHKNVHFVPEEKKIDDLLQEFQEKKVHMSIVVDEYGGVAGLVTLEDIIEEIVGEILDEYDKEQPMIVKVDDKTVLVSGRLSVSDFNQMQNFELVPESEAYETLAGFVFSQLEEVPRKDQKFGFNDHIFVVSEVQGKAINQIRIIKESGVFEDV